MTMTMKDTLRVCRFRPYVKPGTVFKLEIWDANRSGDSTNKCKPSTANSPNSSKSRLQPRRSTTQNHIFRSKTIKTKMIADGTYFIHPDGSAWIAARFRGGNLIATTEQCNADTHAAASDSWGGVVPSEADNELPQVDALPIIRAVMGEDANAEMVVVTRGSPRGEA